jgi:rhodanese-related sulfurtransferase
MRWSFVTFIVVALLLGGALILFSRVTIHKKEDATAHPLSTPLRPPDNPAVRKAEDVVYMLEGISLEDAKRWARRETLITIDCRDVKDFSVGHIPGALSLPEKTSAEWIADFAQKYERTAPLLIYCESEECPLAMDLSVLFLRYGFTNVRYLECGYYGWQDAGSPNLSAGATK